MKAAGTRNARPRTQAPPDPLREEPPADQFCDLVLNGGVASGVVYPWALLELARHYRFKNIGGNSVGAMAAAIAAAAEYGRCNGVENAFEPLRRLPLDLAEEEDGSVKTKMLRLFQPSLGVRRLFDLFLVAVAWHNPEQGWSRGAKPAALNAVPKGKPQTEAAAGPLSCPGTDDSAQPEQGSRNEAPAGPESGPCPTADGKPPGRCPTEAAADHACGPWWLHVASVFRKWALMARALALYGVWTALLPLLVLDALFLRGTAGSSGSIAVVMLAVLATAGAVLLALLIGAWGFYRDLAALADNDYGLCTGRGQSPGEEGLVEWLHRGVQLSAGRKREDPPLTFADLWAAPRFGHAGPAPLTGGLQPPESSINLQMFASNVTQGRPIRLPLSDSGTRLYYHPDEWARYFPEYLIAALNKASQPYVPASRSDPNPADPCAGFDASQRELMARLRELPSGGMPIVVAARLSLCFPVLFSCVQVYAVDYEAPQAERRLRRCLLSDGGLCTNFPIHLFDAAHPRWPTFALLLDVRLKKFAKQLLWLPQTHLEGRGDNWQRFVPGATETDGPLLTRLFGLALGMLLTTKDWNDRVTGRLPHVRNRIVRLALQEGEGQLNLAMSGDTILRMAFNYGTRAGEELVESFAPGCHGIKPAWREHLYVRSLIELRALQTHLKGYSLALQARGSTLPIGDVLDHASGATEALRKYPTRPDPTATSLSTKQRQAVDRAMSALQSLEAELSACESALGPYRPVPEPEMRLRPPL